MQENKYTPLVSWLLVGVFLLSAYFVPKYIIVGINWVLNEKFEYNIITWFAVNFTIMALIGFWIIISETIKDARKNKKHDRNT